MKRVFIIAAALVAALPMAHATTYMFTSSGSYSTSAVTLAAYDCTGTTCLGGSLPPYTLTGSSSTVSYNSTYGAGVTDTNNYVARNSYLVVDFSSPLAAHSTVEVYMDRVSSGYYIFGWTAPTTPNPASITSGLTVLASRLTGGAPAGNIADVYFTLGATAYNYLVITAASTCDLNVKDITTNAPEPGTLVMAGMALIGLGMALRKARKS